MSVAPRSRLLAPVLLLLGPGVAGEAAGQSGPGRPPELTAAAAISTAPLGHAPERGVGVGLQIPAGKRLLLGGKLRWHAGGDDRAPGGRPAFVRTTALFEVAFRYELGRHFQITWVEAFGAGSVVRQGDAGVRDLFVPTLMPAGAFTWKIDERWRISVGGGWLIQWIELEGARRRTSTRHAELALGCRL